MLTLSVRYISGMMTGIVLGLGMGVALSGQARSLQAEPTVMHHKAANGVEVTTWQNGATLVASPQKGSFAVLTKAGASSVFEMQDNKRRIQTEIMAPDGTSADMSFQPLEHKRWRIEVHVKGTTDGKTALHLTTSSQGKTVMEFVDRNGTRYVQQ